MNHSYFSLWIGVSGKGAQAPGNPSVAPSSMAGGGGVLPSNAPSVMAGGGGGNGAGGGNGGGPGGGSGGGGGMNMTVSAAPSSTAIVDTPSPTTVAGSVPPTTSLGPTAAGGGTAPRPTPSTSAGHQMTTTLCLITGLAAFKFVL